MWSKPQLLAAMLLAFLVNMTAYPPSNGLLPYVAKDIYRIDQTGLGYLVASFASAPCWARWRSACAAATGRLA